MENQRTGLFSVDAWGWDEITRRLGGFPDLLQRYYPQFYPGWAAPDFPRRLQLLVMEIERNEQLGGKAAGRPEREHLDGAIRELERIELGEPDREVLWSLYALRTRTDGQESLASYPSPTIDNQYRQYYLKAAERAKDSVQRRLGRLTGDGPGAQGQAEAGHVWR